MRWYPECSEIARSGRFSKVLCVLTKRWKHFFELCPEKKSGQAGRWTKIPHRGFNRSRSHILGNFDDFASFCRTFGVSRFFSAPKSKKWLQRFVKTCNAYPKRPKRAISEHSGYHPKLVQFSKNRQNFPKSGILRLEARCRIFVIFVQL